MTDYWRRKIIAYLHDPPDKALCIVGHERRAAAESTEFPRIEMY